MNNIQDPPDKWRRVNSRLTRPLTEEETEGFRDAIRILEEKFKKQFFSATIEANRDNPEHIYGLYISFNLKKGV